MRAAPFQGRRPSTADRGETEAQRLAREQQDRQFKAAQKDRTALGITNAVLQLTNMGLQAGLKGWELGRDPADVRGAEAEAERFGELAAALRERVAGERSAVTRAGTPRPEEAAPAPAPAAPAAPQGYTPITMSQGDVDAVAAGIANYDRLAAENPRLAQDIATQLTTDEFRLDAKTVESALNQGRFLAKNWQSMEREGALVVAPGPATGFWDKLAELKGEPSWQRGYDIARTAAGGAASLDLMGKLKLLRDKVGDEMFTTVLEKVVQNPDGRRQLQQQGAAIGLGEVDWTNVEEARKAVIGHLVEGPGVRGPARGTARAEETFGEPSQVGAFRLPAGDYYIDQLTDAFTAFKANDDPRAQLFLDERVIGNAVDFEQVPEVQKGASQDEIIAIIRDRIKSGKAEFPQDPRARGAALLEVAERGEELKLKQQREATRARAVDVRAMKTPKSTRKLAFEIQKNPDKQAQYDRWLDSIQFEQLVNGVGDQQGFAREEVEGWLNAYVFKKGSKSEQKEFFTHYNKMYARHASAIGARRTGVVQGAALQTKVGGAKEKFASAAEKHGVSFDWSNLESAPVVTSKDVYERWAAGASATAKDSEAQKAKRQNKNPWELPEWVSGAEAAQNELNLAFDAVRAAEGAVKEYKGL